MERNFVVVGGTRGLGLSLVKLLISDKQQVSVLGLRPPATSVRRNNRLCHWLVDVTDTQALIAAIGDIVEKKGPIHQLIISTRYRGAGDKWIGEIETCLTATKNIIEIAVSNFDSTAQNNSIVLISSVASTLIAKEQDLSYHVAKGGLDQMMRYFAVKLGPQGIRVNAVSPAIYNKEDSSNWTKSNSAYFNVLEKIVPLRRVCAATEIAKVIRFLCSEDASYVTGQNIVVDGGISILAHVY